ncbi:hypothetical protein [Enterobacter intestinihominis]
MQLLPARLDELGRRVGGHLAGVMSLWSPAQHLDGVDGTSLAAGAARNWMVFRNSCRTPAQRGVALRHDAVQEIEVLGLQPLRLVTLSAKSPRT